MIGIISTVKLKNVVYTSLEFDLRKSLQYVTKSFSFDATLNSAGWTEIKIKRTLSSPVPNKSPSPT